MSLCHPVQTRGGDRRWKTRVSKQTHVCTWNPITHEISDSSLMRCQISRAMGVQVQTNASFAFSPGIPSLMRFEISWNWDLNSHEWYTFRYKREFVFVPEISSLMRFQFQISGSWEFKSHVWWDFWYKCELLFPNVFFLLNASFNYDLLLPWTHNGPSHENLWNSCPMSHETKKKIGKKLNKKTCETLSRCLMRHRERVSQVFLFNFFPIFFLGSIFQETRNIWSRVSRDIIISRFGIKWPFWVWSVQMTHLFKWWVEKMTHLFKWFMWVHGIVKCRSLGLFWKQLIFSNDELKRWLIFSNDSCEKVSSRNRQVSKSRFILELTHLFKWLISKINLDFDASHIRFPFQWWFWHFESHLFGNGLYSQHKCWGCTPKSHESPSRCREIKENIHAAKQKNFAERVADWLSESLAVVIISSRISSARGMQWICI